MQTIKISVINKIANSPNAVIVCGNDDYIIEFMFDAEWEAENVKTARFIYNGIAEDIVFTGNSVAVPRLRNVTTLAVGVYAGDLQTTTPALISCKKSILCEEGLPPDPTPDVYTQIMALLNNGGGGSGAAGLSAYAEVYIGDTEPTDENIVLWIDTGESDNTGDDNTGDDNTGDDTGNDNTGGDTGDEGEMDGRLPSAYKELTYVVSPQEKELAAILTGVKLSEIAKFEIGVETDFSKYVMLAYSSDENFNNRGGNMIYNTLNKTAMTGSGYDTFTVSSPSNTDYIGQITRVDFTFEFTNSNDTQHLCIGGGVPSAWAASDKKIYYAKIYDNSNQLLRDYVPCYRKSDDIVGMYDLVEGIFNTPYHTIWVKGAEV